MKSKSVESKLFIETQNRKGGKVVSEEFEEKAVDTRVFDEEPAMVEAKIGMTISLGNYEFLRVDAGVTMPCNKERIRETHEEAFTLAGEELFKRVEEAKKTLID